MDHNRLGGFLQLIREGRAATERVRIVGDGLQAADRLDRGIGGYDRVATGPQAVGPRVGEGGPYQGNARRQTHDTALARRNRTAIQAISDHTQGIPVQAGSLQERGYLAGDRL